MPADLLRAHEFRSPQHDARGRELLRARTRAVVLGEAEVHHHRAFLTIVLLHDHHVFGLQVPVDDVKSVRVV